MTPNTEAKKENPLMIYWDDAHIEQESLLFPKAMQELYRRVKITCRTKYNSDMDQITAAFAALGVKRDKTTWTRIFKKGRWLYDTEGNKLPSPLVNLQKLQEDFTAFLTGTRVELQRGTTPFIETSTYHTIRRYVEKKMRPDWVNKFGLVVGPTGVQKSASYRELAMRDPNIKHIESNDNASMTQFITLLAYKYGCGFNRSHNEKKFKIYESFGPGKCLILDNTQDLIQVGNDVLKQPAFNFLRWLQDERGGTIILSITPDDEATVFKKNSVYMEQFEGRVGGLEEALRLPNDVPKRDLVDIAKGLNLVDAEDHAEDLVMKLGRLRGRIRAFFEVLQKARFAATADGEVFTWDYVEDALTDRGVRK